MGNTHKRKTNHGDKKYYNEYYTSIDEVKFLFTEIIDLKQLENKTIYCPCDSDKSAFTIWLEEHKEEYKLKEFFHTSDDFNNHDDLFAKADVIITNPPFQTKYFYELFEKIKTNNLKFFLFYSGASLGRLIAKFDSKYMFENTNYVFRNNNYNFTHIDGNEYNVAYTIYFYNIKLENIEKIKKFYKTSNKTYKEISLRCGDYLAVDNFRDIPYDYDKWIVAPCSCFSSQNKWKNQFDFAYMQENLTFSDGKNRFVRFYVKRKPEFVGQKFI